MGVKEKDIDTGKIKGYGICKKKYKILIVGGPITPTYSISSFSIIVRVYSLYKKKSVRDKHECTLKEYS